jgi:hypothetical protein
MDQELLKKIAKLLEKITEVIKIDVEESYEYVNDNRK